MAKVKQKETAGLDEEKRKVVDETIRKHRSLLKRLAQM
jgi:hypothetical protein